MTTPQWFGFSPVVSFFSLLFLASASTGSECESNLSGRKAAATFDNEPRLEKNGRESSVVPLLGEHFALGHVDALISLSFLEPDSISFRVPRDEGND